MTKTLFHYLNNGCNINKTARAINFSITGLRYRIQKINELLETDINVPDVGYQIYLSLKLLIYWGELDIDVRTSNDLNGEDHLMILVMIRKMTARLKVQMKCVPPT